MDEFVDDLLLVVVLLAEGGHFLPQGFVLFFDGVQGLVDQFLLVFDDADVVEDLVGRGELGVRVSSVMSRSFFMFRRHFTVRIGRSKKK